MSPELLAEVIGCPRPTAERFAPHITRSCAEFEINTPARLAAYLAQLGHESGSLSASVESLNYTVESLLSKFGRHRISEADAQRLGRAPGRPADQEAIANTLYGGAWGLANLGNTEPGDGWRYRGRGPIQTTGRANYRAARDRLRRRIPETPDFEAVPEALEDPAWGAWAAAAFWDSRGLNALADVADFDNITRRINGGINGRDDRRARWARAKRALGITGTKEDHMPLTAFAKAALSVIAPNVPTLARMFTSGSEVSERNIKAAELALQVVQQATGATNAQEAAERVARDPAAAEAAEKAVREHWLEISEAGGGGIEGARKADAAMVDREGPWWQVLRSPSFLVAVMLMPLVYMIVGSVVGLYGEAWPPEVRAAIAGTVTGTILGGLVGYYYGQTTSRNRTPAGPQAAPAR